MACWASNWPIELLESQQNYETEQTGPCSRQMHDGFETHECGRVASSVASILIQPPEGSPMQLERPLKMFILEAISSSFPSLVVPDVFPDPGHLNEVHLSAVSTAGVFGGSTLDGANRNHLTGTRGRRDEGPISQPIWPTAEEPGKHGHAGPAGPASERCLLGSVPRFFCQKRYGLLSTCSGTFVQM